MANMKLRLNKNAFISLPILLAVVVFMGTLAITINPLLRTQREKTKVDDLITKEQLFRDAFVQAVEKSQGNIDFIKDGRDLIKFMLHEKFLPIVQDGEKEDYKYYLSNGFGGDIKIIYTEGAWVSICSSIPKGSYAKRYYLASGSKSDISFEDGDKCIGKKYSIPIKSAMLILNARVKTSDEQSFTQPLAGKAWKESQNIKEDEKKESLGVMLMPQKPTTGWSGSNKSTW